jgi:cell division protein FtsQ
VATRGRAGSGARARTRAESVVVPFPRPSDGNRLPLGQLVPSGRSLAVAFAVLLGALACWLLARETGVFGVRAIAVEGASPGIANQVERALGTTRGESLLGLDLEEARQAVQALPTVAAARFDRAYPHTLRVVVTPERPVAVVRHGSSSLLVSDRGRVIRTLERGKRPELARLWVARNAEGLAPGATVGPDVMPAVRAVSPLAGTRFPARVTSVRLGEDALTLRLRSGMELRMGSAHDLELKLAIAARVLPLLQPGTTYVDVSVLDRPVAGTESDAQAPLEVEGLTSTLP